jgi:hypothetical protein
MTLFASHRVQAKLQSFAPALASGSNPVFFMQSMQEMMRRQVLGNLLLQALFILSA